MKDRVPWHVKGVRRQTRDTAREAARRSGMSVGQWLNNVIAERAAANGVYPPGPDGDWRDAGNQQIAQSINRLDQRLDQLITHGRLTGSPLPANHHPSPSMGTYPPPPSNGHYPPGPPPPNGHWSSGIDQAVAEISARQRALEIDPQARGPALPPVDYGHRTAPPPAYTSSPAYGPPPDLSGLEQQLRNITTQIENLNRPGELTDALSGLRSDLAEIARMLTEAMPRRAVEALEIEVRKLAERIDMTREAGVDPSTIANMERGLADLREALSTLTPAESLVGFDDAVRGLSRKIDQMALQHDPANLQQLEAAITALRGIVSHVASNDTLLGLAEEMRGLSAKVDRVANAAMGPDGLLTQTQSGEPIMSAIERGFAELTSRLFAAGPAPDAMDHLKRDLERTQDSLEAVHGTLGHLVDRLAMIEGGLRPDASPPPHGHSRPAPSFVPQQRSGHPLAPGSAPFTDAPMVTMPFPAPSMQQPPGSGGPMGASAVSAPPLTAAVMEPPSHAPTPRPVSLPAIVPPPPERAEPAAKPKTRPPFAHDRQPIDPNLPPDFPLEPGSGVPRAHPPGSAAERIAAPEAALGPAKPPNANHPGQTNFIAAARRAAQAAGPGAEPDTPPPPQAGPAKSDRPAKSLSQRVRSLIIGGSAVLIVLASMRVALQVMESAPDAAIESSAQTALAPEPATTNSAPVDRIPVVRQNDGIFATTPPAGLIVPGEPIGKPDTVPVARMPDPDITGSTGPRHAPAASSPEPRLGLSDKLPVSLRQAAVSGDPAAEYEVALRHLDGRGIPQNFEEAARWLERAAKAGLAPAQFRLGGLYEKGQGVRKNPDTARRHYVAAAEKGNAKAMHNLAVIYSEGIDGKPDYKAASLWFRKAAEHGIADSQYNLGVLYARGIGIERNLAESYKWFALAAAQGDRDAATKRDDVAARLDQESLAAAKLAVQGFVAEPQPEAAIAVKAPPGGWEKPSEGPRPTKKKGPGAPMKIAPS